MSSPGERKRSGWFTLAWALAAVGLVDSHGTAHGEPPRLGPLSAMELRPEYHAFCPDPTSKEPVIMLVVMRKEPSLGRHLLQAWQDAATRQGVTLLAPANLQGSLEERVKSTEEAVATWERYNMRQAEYRVVLGYSLSTTLAIEEALATPEEWAGLALTPCWEIEPPLKSKLGALKGMPVFLLYSEKHRGDLAKAKNAQRDFEAAGCVVHLRALKEGDNMQTTYHNGDTIMAWVRQITRARREQPPPTTQPVGP